VPTRPTTLPHRRPTLAATAVAVALLVAVPVSTGRAAENPRDPEAMIAYAVKSGERTWKKAQGPAAGLSSRELFTCALALAEADRHPDRLATLFDVAARMQDREPESRGYGNFRWSWRDDAVLDWNAVEFCMQGGALLWMRHRDWMPAEARRTFREILDYAVEGCLRHRVRPSYTNIALMNAENLILLGETLGRDDAAREGYRRLDAFVMHTYEHGITEYASPCYYGVDLDCLVLIERFCGQARTRAQARALLDLFWTDVAAHFFPPSGRLAGPHSRDYNYLRGNGSVLDNHLWAEGWLDGGIRGRTGILWPALARWHPPERLLEMSRTRLPRLVRQSWGAEPHQARTHYVLDDVTLGAASAHYHQMDLPLTVDLPGDADFPRCYFLPDARHDPYGTKRIAVGGGHAKTIHLRPFWTAAQRRTDALGLVLYRNEPQTREAETLESHFVMPRRVDAFWIGDKQVDVSGAEPAEWPVEGSAPVVLRRGTAAVGVRVVWARRAGGGPAPAALVWDGNKHGVVRLTVAHHHDGVPDDVTGAGAALWVRVGSGLKTDADLETFRRGFAFPNVDGRVAGNRILINVPAATPLTVEAGYPDPGEPRLDPPPSDAVLDIDGKDVGRAILARIEPVRSYVKHVEEAPPVIVPAGEPLTLEAESGFVVLPFTVGEDGGASGGRFVWCPGEPGEHGQAGGRCVWKLDVAKAGPCHLWGRVRAPTSSDDSFYVAVFDARGRPLQRAEWHTGGHKAWQWTRLTDGNKRAPAALRLPKGVVRLEIQAREDGTQLDRLFLAPDAGARPE